MDQQNLFSQSDLLGKEPIGCCSLFRECSNAGYCLKSGLDTGERCSYRLNLESGRIFYGKRSPNFDRELYEKFQEVYETRLEPAQRDALFPVLDVFFRAKRGSHTALFYADPAYPALEKYGFFTIIRDSYDLFQAIVQNYRLKALTAVCDMDNALAYAISVRGPKPPKVRRNELLEYIALHDQAAFDLACKDFALLYIKSGKFSFTLDEWFTDQHIAPCDLKLPDNDERFLGSVEEE